MSTSAIVTQFSFGFSRPVSHCAICGRTLTNRNSIVRGIGPICSSHRQGAANMKNPFNDHPIPSDLTNGIILERNDGHIATNVPHLVTHHSPTGYEFGYGGSGPADLALNIVEAALLRLGWIGDKINCFDGQCFQMSWSLHQEFKWRFIAPAPRAGYTIPWQTVIDWIQERMPSPEAAP